MFIEESCLKKRKSVCVCVCVCVCLYLLNGGEKETGGIVLRRKQ